MVLLAESAARLTEAHHAYLTTIAVCAGKRADAVDQTASSSFRVAQIGDRIINIQVFKPGPYNRFGALGALLADWNVSPAAASVPRTSASGVGLSGRKSQRSPDRPLHGRLTMLKAAAGLRAIRWPRRCGSRRAPRPAPNGGAGTVRELLDQCNGEPSLGRGRAPRLWWDRQQFAYFQPEAA
jgi:hypothetical protein